ncbi:MAG TPA: mechanosensitive ion channel domain-containing protein [Burkholderiales bacterium]|nr:mechanosensitive ion channel domain-containing protein [Burkholderiales bacterium]
MLSTSPPNLLLNLWMSLHDVAVLWQVAAATASLLLAWLLCRALRLKIASMENSSSFGRDAIAMLQFPIFAVLLILGAQALMGGGNLTFLELMVALLTAAIIIRLVVVMLRQVFAPSGWRDALIRMIATAVWIGFALHVAGLLPDLLKFLDALGFAVGKGRISLLLILQGLLSVMATLLLALWLGRFIEARTMATTDLDINLRVMISKLAQALLVLAAILLALPAVGIDLTVLSVFGGALGVGLGFGLQKIASNYISGFIILLDRSVSLGNLVTIDQHTGQLTKMTARYVVVRNLAGVEAIIPNDTLITSTVINKSYTDTRVRQTLPVQVAYNGDLELALRILVEIAQRQQRVLADPAPRALITKFADSGIDLELGFWVDDPEAGTGILRSALHLEIWREFRQHQIEIPYPQRTVRLVGEPMAPNHPPKQREMR